MLIKVRGITYPSVKVAAEALGLSAHGVYSALQRGDMDKLGLGTTRCKPVTIGTTTFRSMSAASAALGFRRSYLGWALLHGKFPAQERIRIAAEQYKTNLNKGDLPL